MNYTARIRMISEYARCTVVHETNRNTHGTMEIFFFTYSSVGSRTRDRHIHITHTAHSHCNILSEEKKKFSEFLLLEFLTLSPAFLHS